MLPEFVVLDCCTTELFAVLECWTPFFGLLPDLFLILVRFQSTAFAFFFSFRILCGLIALCVVGFQFWTHCFCLQAEFFVNVVLILGLVAEFFFLNFFGISDRFSSEKKDML